eukprot:gnl/Carplike_NY0171/5533_a7573_290.p1 GENE.gnl/Carplike_NY0171/5533_a7573_290~~gnl/Carplike_NY0171/5533_a7573_290.p1  ORF type:complete len:540 (-),score=110.87 gnl/Carplike_NY0171/5533_a7573_290:148-1560(-)
MLTTAVYSTCDSIYIGKYSTDSLASTSVFMAFEMVVSSMAQGLFSASAALLAEAQGAKNIDRMNHIVAVAFKMAISYGILVPICCLPVLEPLVVALGARDDLKQESMDYGRIILIGTPFGYSIALLTSSLIRAMGKPMVSMLIGIASALINVAVDPLLIFSADMGVKGAACSTIIAQYVVMPFSIWYLVKKCGLSLKMDHFWHWDLKIAFKAIILSLATGLPSALQNFITILVNNQIHAYAPADQVTDLLAIIGVVGKLSIFIILPTVAVGIAGTVIWSSNMGAKLMSRIKKTVLYVCIIQIVICAIVEIIFQSVPEKLLRMFADEGDDDDIIALGVAPLRTMISGLVMCFGSLTAAIFFQAMQRPVISIGLSLLRQCVLYIIFLYSLPPSMGLDGIYLTYPLSDVISGIIGLIVMIVGTVKLPTDGESMDQWKFMKCKSKETTDIVSLEDSDVEVQEMVKQRKSEKTLP